MSRSTIEATLLLALASGALAGCSLFPDVERPIYVGPGEIVELAEPEKFTGWITNAETGRRERRRVEAAAGWFVGRPTPEDAAAWAGEMPAETAPARPAAVETP